MECAIYRLRFANLRAPESQLWTLREPDKSRIERGLAWAAATPAKETDVADIVAKAKQRKKR